MRTRTKIICTIGPSVNTPEKIEALIHAGMNVARLNFSHGTHAEHLKVIECIKEVRKKLKVPLAIMLDTKGPEVRIGTIKEGALTLEAGQLLKIGKGAVEIKPEHVLSQLTEGTRVLFDDGYITSTVVSKNSSSVTVKIENGGVLRSGKGVNVPDVILDLPAVTEKDIEDIRFGCKQDVEYIAASFVRSPNHIVEIKKILEEEGKGDTLVIAKIESNSGVYNFESIVQVADGIMIARGDLGVEVPLSQVPKLQKMMIRKSYLAGKPSVTATQMLESMMKSPRPTRAEASDVANAIYDSTSCVMLSGETAVGDYPIETVKVMKELIKEAEGDFDYRAFFDVHAPLSYHDIPFAISMATVKIAYSSHAKAFFIFTSSGSTARLISRLRPPMPIIAMTPKEKCYHQMAANWGVIPVLGNACETVEEAFEQLSEYAVKHKLVTEGDLVIVTAGTPFGESGTTNMMIVESIGNVLLRGYEGFGVPVTAEVVPIFSPHDKKPKEVKNCLLVMTQCDESYLPLIRKAAGIILQNHIDDIDSEAYAMQVAQELGKSVLIRAGAALRLLPEGQIVTLQPDRALVYK